MQSFCNAKLTKIAGGLQGGDSPNSQSNSDRACCQECAAHIGDRFLIKVKYIYSSLFLLNLKVFGSGNCKKVE